MPVKRLKRNTAGRRHMSVNTFSDITKKKPVKKLTEAKKRKAGRNAQGRITVRHRGGGVKRLYRMVDFKRFTCLALKHHL